MWFQKLTGFAEEKPDQVRSKLKLEGNRLISTENGKSWTWGHLTLPTLAELREQSPDPESFKSRIQVREQVADVQELHLAPENAGALFQAASQFNLLEMIQPKISPEMGIGRYSMDKTQGPACAIACGPGTIYRNYFLPLGEQLGQTRDLQVNCLDEIGKYFENEKFSHWTMQNGYALPSHAGLQHISRKISELGAAERSHLKGLLRIGIQWDTEVSLPGGGHLLTQAYCSALPVAYSQHGLKAWEEFAKLILDATYEATFFAALQNFRKTGNPRLFLTLVGGGAFGNANIWIMHAIKLALRKFSSTPLEVRIVSYGRANPVVNELLEAWKAESSPS